MGCSLKKSVTVAAALVCTLAGAAHAAMTISSAKTKNVTCTGGVCTSTGSNANLNVGELTSMLASSDVTVKAAAVTPSLGVLDPLTWASSHRLTLDSYQYINVKAPIVIEGTAGLTLITNDGGTGGDYSFENGASATFWDLHSSLIINGNAYTLAGDIKTLASDIIAHPSHFFALGADYDAGQDGHYGTAPLGDFTGTFEGLGHAISKLTIRLPQPDIAGLFYKIDKLGVVRDIALVRAAVSGGGYVQIGALAGLNQGRILNSSSSGSIHGGQPSAKVGGLVGINDSSGKIIGSSSTASVSGGNLADIGGLAGVSYGVIEASHASGMVTGSVSSVAGGLVGDADSGTILASFATGDISTSGGSPSSNNVGGLVGISRAHIRLSFATGHAKGSSAREGHVSSVGGLVGGNGGSIENSYATGGSSIISAPGRPFKPDAFVGGLVGQNDGTISTSYASGPVETAEFEFSGGLTGVANIHYSHIDEAYWDLDTSGITNPDQGAGDPLNDPGITGLTDAQLKSGLPTGFDPNIWGQNAGINNGWPYLLANPPQ